MRGAACWALGLLLLASVPTAWADGCKTSLEDDSGSLVCDGTIPADLDGQDWEEVLASIANATSVTAEFNDIAFEPATFTRLMDIALGVGASANTGTVVVSLTNCSMDGAKVDYGSLSSLAGPKQYSVLLRGCTFTANKLNLTGAVAAQTDYSLAMQLLGTELVGNELMVLGLAAVGGAGQASFTLAESTAVANNTLVLIGGMGVGGAGELTVQLASTNVTGNRVSGGSAVLVGGAASFDASGVGDEGVDVSNNTADISIMVSSEEPIVGTIVGLVVGLGFDDPAFSVSQGLQDLQGEVCSALDKDTWAAADMPAELQTVAQQTEAMLCMNGTANPDVDLSGMAASLEGLAGQGMEGIASLLASLLGGQNGTADLVQTIIAGIQDPGSANFTTALDQLLSQVLSSPTTQDVASGIADLLTQLGNWLNTPLGGGGNDSSSGGGKGEQPDLGNVIQSIIGSISGAVGGNGSEAQGVADGIAGLISDLQSGNVTPGDAVNSVVTALTGGENGPLAGTNITSLIPIISAVLKDPEALASLPNLITGLVGGGGGGGLDLAALSPLLSAILGDPAASASLPSLLGLLNGLGISLPGSRK